MDWGISTTSVGRLQQAGAPFALMVVLAYLQALCGPISRSVDLVELFSGAGHLSDQFRAHGMRALTFDLSDDPDLEDMTTVIGMVHAILLVPHLSSHASHSHQMLTVDPESHLISGSLLLRGAPAKTARVAVGWSSLLVVHVAKPRHEWSIAGPSADACFDLELKNCHISKCVCY